MPIAPPAATTTGSAQRRRALWQEKSEFKAYQQPQPEGKKPFLVSTGKEHYATEDSFSNIHHYVPFLLIKHTC